MTKNKSGCSAIHQWDEEGCFVYKVVYNIRVAVRKEPNVADEAKRKERDVGPGDLVSIDLIRHIKGEGEKNNGPYLRLSDGSGWLFVHKHGIRAMKRLPVELNQIWTFYGDNYPVGVCFRDHPNDHSPKLKQKVLPMQKVYCDAKVVNDSTGACFYRVQGTKNWIFDRRVDENTKKTIRTMLLPPSKISKGLFAYRSVNRCNIRCEPNTSDDSRTTRRINNGDVCVADTIRQGKGGDGPYIRLTDGSGWLFVSKDYVPMLEEGYVELGQQWRFEVVHPVGIALRKQPMDRQNNHYDGIVYENGDIVTCDAKIEGPSGVNFFRVKGTDGWVFDRRGNSRMLEPYFGWYDDDEENSSRSAGKSKESWTIDFVRGVAAAFSDTLHEIDLIETSRVISFSKEKPNDEEKPIRINVYYTTRTVGTCMDHPIQGKTQMFRRNCTTSELVEIFRNPRVHTGKGYQRRPKTNHHFLDQFLDDSDEEGDVQNELELRERLLECDEEISKNLSRRVMLCRIIDEYDEKRRKEEGEMDTKRAKHMKAVQAEILQQQEDERKRQEQEQERVRQQQEQERNRIRREQSTCHDCNREFVNEHALNQHLRDFHGLGCGYCDRIFKSHSALNQHRDAVGHW